jgi:hypothetical protein
METTESRTGERESSGRSRRSFIRQAVALFAGLCVARAASADTVVYDEYGNPIVVDTSTTVVTGTAVYPYPAVSTMPVYGAVGVRGQSRRVARRTSRRTARRW